MVVFERNMEIEAKIGLKIENLSFNIEKTYGDDQKTNIFGEFSLKNYEDYSGIYFKAVFYDDANNIVNTHLSLKIDLNDFLGQMAFKMEMYESLENLNRIKTIKIYPEYLEKKLIQNNVKSKDKVTLETDEMLVKIYLKKDYSLTDSFNERSVELLDDIHEVINKFGDSGEFKRLIKYYD